MNVLKWDSNLSRLQAVCLLYLAMWGSCAPIRKSLIGPLDNANLMCITILLFSLVGRHANQICIYTEECFKFKPARSRWASSRYLWCLRSQNWSRQIFQKAIICGPLFSLSASMLHKMNRPFHSNALLYSLMRSSVCGWHPAWWHWLEQYQSSSAS